MDSEELAVRYEEGVGFCVALSVKARQVPALFTLSKLQSWISAWSHLCNCYPTTCISLSACFMALVLKLQAVSIRNMSNVMLCIPRFSCAYGLYILEQRFPENDVERTVKYVHRL